MAVKLELRMRRRGAVGTHADRCPALHTGADTLRCCPRDSPQAAVPIVALTLLADANFCRSEWDIAASQGAQAQLGLSPAKLHDVVRDLCCDMVTTGATAWDSSSRIDRRTLSALLAEVQDPELQLKVLKLCVAVVETDEHAAEGDSAVLAAALTQSGLPQTRQQGTQPALLDA
jgi:hypothetical protein